MNDNYNDLLKKLKKQEKTEILTSFRLFNICTFKIGGIADLVISPSTEEEFITTLRVLREANIPYIVVGSASNLLFSDQGFKGAVIRTHRLNGLSASAEAITAQAGVPLRRLCRAAMEKYSGGFHGLCGIPGTVGGSLVTAAGAFGCNIFDCICSCRIYRPQTNKIEEISLNQEDFAYRKCPEILKSSVILSARFSLTAENEAKESIQEKIRLCAEKRKLTQPYGMPSAGSYFKRPENAPPAAYLIDKAGLKGTKRGGAQVSEKHAGFIVNTGHATSKDVKDLAEHVKEQVYKSFSVELKEEVISVPPKL